MPAITRVKDLYMAKSVGELNSQANDKTTLIIKASAPNQVINSMEKVFHQAEFEYNCGDEEKAYIFYMRAASLYQAVKSPRLKEDKKYGKMFEEAVNKCEGLARNLEKRYSEAYKPNTPSSTMTTTSLPMPGKTVKAINSKNLSNNSNNNNSPKSAVNNNNLNNGFKDDLSYVNNRRDDCNITQIDGDITTPTIEPTELFELIEDLQKNRPQDTLLLLDARRKEDFDASHISNLKTDRAKLLNIPEKLLVKGTAATKLMKMLPENAQTILKERRTARKVIIFDWQSTSHNQNEYLDALYAALWKFDPKDGCQSPPILLKTGYYGWLASYPTFTSNPKVTPPPSADDSSNVSDYDSASINYYTRLIKSEDSSPTPEKPKTLINGSSHQSESSDDVVSHDVDMGTVQDSNELVVRLTNSKLNANKIPGSAQPVPTVNRQVKPKLSKNELNVATVSPFNKISKNDKPNGLTQPPTNHPTNGAIYENNNNIIERELKARRALEAQEEINKLKENDYEKGHREKDEMLKKMEADRENLLRENVDLKRRLKPNPSPFNSLNSSSSSPLSTSSSSPTTATGTTMSSVLSREPLKPPVRFNMIGENGDSDDDESENEREMVSKDSDEEMCSPLHRPKLETKLITPKASSKRSDERTVSESSSSLISTPRPPSSIAKTGKSLPRSYSSPNIADHYDDDDSQNRPPTNHHHPPTFDRALKPLNNGTEGFPRSFTSSTRMRNFSPIYGIPGQVNTGLKNLGNTCFMNAVLQCLADTSIFRRYFLQEKHMADISRNSRLGSKGELADELGALIREIRSNQYKSVSPSHFKDAVGTHMPFFMGCEQQDAHEFLCMLLEKLHADLNKAPQANVSNGIFTLPDDLPPNIAINKFWTHHLSRNRSIVSDLFEGLLMSTLKCTACGKQSHSFEVFTNLSLPIPTKLGHRFTILDCLDLFSDEEKLFGEAAWECPTCKTKRDAIKQIKICKLPKVLVIHLKRFSYEGKWRQKLQNMVDFPLFDLKLKKYRSCNSLDPVGFDASYDLYGVVNHYGTLEGGHYVAYCKNDEKNKWFKYDDHEVTELSAADVKSHAAYLLFYTSRN